MKPFRLTALLVVTLSAAILVQSRYDRMNQYFAKRNVSVNLPSATTLKIASLGYREFAADLLYIWAIQFFSNKRIENRFDYLESVFQLITDLSPHHTEIYHIGGMIMSDDKEDPEMAIRLLLKGGRNNPGHYIFFFAAGFEAFKIGQFQRARDIFSEGAAQPSISREGKNKLLRFKSLASYYGNDLQTAFDEWMKVYRSPHTRPAEKRIAEKYLYQIQARMDIQTIQSAIDLYRKKFNRNPSSLQELKDKGYLWQIPRDFFDAPYRYNPETGKVSAKKVYRLFNPFQ